MGVDRLAFGRLVRRERDRQGLSLAKLGFRIGELADGTILDGAAVRAIENGGRAVEDDPELYERVIAVLGLDRDEAHAALWPLPEGITLKDIREMRAASELRATRTRTAATRVAAHEGASLAATKSPSDQAIQTKRTWRELAGQDDLALKRVAA